MRTYLIILIALLVSSYGCSDGKKAASRTTDEVAQNQGTGTLQTPGISDEMKKRMDEEKAKREGEKDESMDEEKDMDDDKAMEEEKDMDDDKAMDDEPEEREQARRAPTRNRGGVNRRRRVENPSMAGGGLEAERKRREAEAANRNQNQGQNTPPPRDRDEPDEEERQVKLPSLMERAERAFAMKHDPEAFQYLYAHFLTDDDAIESFQPSWFTGINEPRISLRWGVAVNYMPKGFEGDPPKIGDAVETSDNTRGNNRRGGNRRGGGGDLGGAGGATGGSFGISGGRSQRERQRRGLTNNNNNNRNRNGNSTGRSPSESLTYYTGDFGESFVDRYEMRRLHNDAFYGSIMKEIKNEIADEPEEQPQQRQRARRGGGDLGSFGGGSQDVQRRERDRNQGGGDSESEYEAEQTALAPGLMYLGEGSKNKMLSHAKAYNIDVLVVFDVEIKHTEQRNGDTDTVSRTAIKLYSVKTGKELVGTRKLSHKKVANDRRRDAQDDPVQIELDRVFSKTAKAESFPGADTVFKAKEMPAANPSAFVKRYNNLLNEDYANPLPILVEIKHYYKVGHITQNDYVAACQKLLGDVAAQDLIDGDMKRRESAIKKYLPGQYEVDTDGEEFR